MRCVDVSRMSADTNYAPLVLGRIYRVRRAWTISNGRGVVKDILTLREYPDSRRFWMAASRFVPVDDGAIGIFRSLLAPTPKEPIVVTWVPARTKEKA